MVVSLSHYIIKISRYHSSFLRSIQTYLGFFFLF